MKGVSYRLTVARHAPPGSDPEADKMPFGVHPVLDTMLMAIMIAETQRDVFDALRSQNRAILLLSILWAMLALLMALR